MKIEEWKYIAETLWGLLDDIDTGSDIFKPEKNCFYEYTMGRVAERFKLMKSDGYDLIPMEKSKEREIELLTMGAKEDGN